MQNRNLSFVQTVHPHTHTQFSESDMFQKFKPFFKTAISDHFSMFSSFQLYVSELRSLGPGVAFILLLVLAEMRFNTQTWRNRSSSCTFSARVLNMKCMNKDEWTSDSMSFIGHEVKKKWANAIFCPRRTLWSTLWSAHSWWQDVASTLAPHVGQICICKVFTFTFSLLHSMDLKTSSDLRTTPMPGLLALTSDWKSHAILRLGHFCSGMIQSEWEWSKWCVSHTKSWTFLNPECVKLLLEL